MCRLACALPLAAFLLLVLGAHSELHTPGSIGCLRDVQVAIHRAHEYALKNFAGEILLFDVALIPNLGDGILWLGAKYLIRAYKRNPDTVCSLTQGQYRLFPTCPDPATVANITLTQPVVLLWHAGGNFGDVWRFVQYKRMEYLVELDKALARINPAGKITFVCLPQSVHYGSMELAAKDLSFINNATLVKFHLEHRAWASANATTQWFPSDRPNLYHVSPDLAFMVGPLTSIWQPKVDVLVLMRYDKEAALSYQTAADIVIDFFKLPENKGVTYRITDWQLFKWHGEHHLGIYADLADLRMQEAVYTVSKGRVLVANRLHAVVTAALLHTPCFWYDGQWSTAYRKIESTVTTAFSFSPLCTNETMLSFQTQPTVEHSAPVDKEKHLLLTSLANAVAYLRAHNGTAA